ncbi:MAG: class I SAM-dependent methyltransferase [Candidatus ainarchaeum sp.]|nr:class I SAM-dependent methyltransferase [Candidatus ainarchaeum sp.]MDD3976265.1 class I SAM-dependent methyltransferase [Candidatus ainarchaeum sp.]
MQENITPEMEFEDPNSFYTKKESNRYEYSSGMKKTQNELTQVALDLSDFEKTNFSNLKVLDIGCGTGFSLEYLVFLGFEKNNLIGIEPSLEMKAICENKGFLTKEGGFEDLSKLDLEKNYFDLIISISAFQWVLTNKSEIEIKNVCKKISKSIFSLLKENGKAIFQFYPPFGKNNEKYIEIILSIFNRIGFSSKKYIFKENSIKKRKYFLIFSK